MKLTYDGCSKKGTVREINEDAILMRASGEAALFLVADGIGGRENGEVVSSLLADGYSQWWEKDFSGISGSGVFQRSLEAIKEKLLQINQEVVQRFGEWSAGSTLAMLFQYGQNCAYLSAGDSRIYRMRGLSMQQVTRDDVFENLPDEWAVKYSGSTAGKLVGAVGINNELDYTVRTDIIRPGDRFFLCSDGVYGYVPERRLRNHLAVGSFLRSPKSVVESLCKEVDRNGSGDNYSLICIKTR